MTTLELEDHRCWSQVDAETIDRRLTRIQFVRSRGRDALSNPVAYKLNQSREDSDENERGGGHYREKSQIRMRVALRRLMNPSAWRVPSAQSCD